MRNFVGLSLMMCATVVALACSGETDSEPAQAGGSGPQSDASTAGMSASAGASGQAGGSGNGGTGGSAGQGGTGTGASAGQGGTGTGASAGQSGEAGTCLPPPDDASISSCCAQGPGLGDTCAWVNGSWTCVIWCGDESMCSASLHCAGLSDDGCVRYCN